MTRQKDCKTCPLYRSCPYTNIFETPAPTEHRLQKFSQIPNPYVIEAPSWGRKRYEIGEKICFSIVLFGNAVDQLALVVYAIKRAFSYDVGHGRAELNSVYFCAPNDNEELIYCEEQSSIGPHDASLTLSKVSNSSVLHFLTPLRLQNNGHGLLPNQITASVLQMAMVRRISLLSDFHQRFDLEFPFVALKSSAMDSVIRVDSRWQDWVRYSNRQQQKMHLGGVLGTVILSEIHPVFSLLLELGQWTHIGKSASFGMGRYVLE